MIFERGHFDNKVVNESKVNDSYRTIRKFNASTENVNKPTVFLSHKHDDLNDLKGVIGLLVEYGAKIYIDSMDKKLPNETTGETAKRIKEVIKFSKKFILLATDKAIESYWCNWELGIGDINKYINNIAILPIKEKETSDYKFKGNEYLQIYPRITYNKAFTNLWGTFFKEGYYVEQPVIDGHLYITEFSEWLKQ
jgi:hypothetical protein